MVIMKPYQCVLLKLLLFCCFFLAITSGEIETEASIQNETLFEGDIIGVPLHLTGRHLYINESETRDVAIRWDHGKWPNGEVPYTIKNSFVGVEKYIIRLAMKEIEKNTCVRFLERYDQGTYVEIRKIPDVYACRSQIGFEDRGPRKIYLHERCMTTDEILHELMHTLGFFHEHTRMDRDNYINIILSNVDPSKWHNFNIRSFDNATQLDTDYDFTSVMHYNVSAFAKSPGLVTIQSIVPGTVIKSDGLSKMDILRINRLYKCHNYLQDSRKNFETKTTENAIPQEVSACEHNLIAETNLKYFYSNVNDELSDSNSNFCKWTIRSVNSTRIELKFERFDLECGRNDRVEIFYGNSVEWHREQKDTFHCNSSIPLIIESLYPILRIHFYSSGSLVADGFKISYKISNVSYVCSYVLIADEKPRYIRSHIGFGHEDYSYNLDCSWKLSSTNSKDVWLLMDEFRLNYGYKACTDETDRLEFGRTDKYPSSITTIYFGHVRCGSYGDDQQLSQKLFDKEILHLRFLTNDSSNTYRRGFQFTYFTESSEGFTACGSTLIARDTVRSIYSHQTYDTPNYANNYSCTWTIRATNGKRVKLMVVKFHLQKHSQDYSCSYDYLEVYDGRHTNAKKIGQFCGNRVRRVIFSSGQGLYLKFHTDHNITNFGFHLVYYSID